MNGYRTDLAYIHDAGFGDYARKAAPNLLRLLTWHRLHNGKVIDLGCGSGILARELCKAGYEVLGVDISASMIDLARKKAPHAEFRIGSLLRVPLPECSAVISIGECINYLFDAKNGNAARLRLFRRIHTALLPGGVFIFDFAEPGRAPESPRRSWMEGRDWAVLVETEGSRRQRRLNRRIICFRKMAAGWRRSQEKHRLQLYECARLLEELEQIGFQVEQLNSYGRFRLLPGTAALLAKKR